MSNSLPYQTKRSTGSLLLDLDPRRRAALFDQIYQQIRLRILGGELERGAALPASRRLALELGVSRTTVLQAIDALRTEGYVVASPRSAVRVVADLPDPELSGGARRGSAPAIAVRL